MKKFISVVVSLGLLLLVSACKPDTDKSLSTLPQEQEEFSNKIKNLLTELELLEKKVSNLRKIPSIAGSCTKFANSLVELAKKVMAKGRNPKINFMILDMAYRTVKVGRKIKNVLVDTDPDTAGEVWGRVVSKRDDLFVLDMINLITYDDSYNSHEAVKYELLEISDRYIFPRVYMEDEIWFENYELIEKFYAKLQKIGCYNVQQFGKVQEFLEYIKKHATKTKKEKKDDILWLQIHELFGINEISEDVIVKEWLPCLRMIERCTPQEASEWCHFFSNSLSHLGRKIMTDKRDPKLNAMVLEISSRLMEVTRKARNTLLKKNQEKNELATRQTQANTMWLSVSANDYNLRIWNIMNMVAYDDEYDSIEAIEYELDNIGNLVNKSTGPRELYTGESKTSGQGSVYFDSALEDCEDKLVEKFHEKLEKVEGYKIKHSEPVQKFLDEVQKRVQEINKNSKKN